MTNEDGLTTGEGPRRDDELISPIRPEPPFYTFKERGLGRAPGEDRRSGEPLTPREQAERFGNLADEILSKTIEAGYPLSQKLKDTLRYVFGLAAGYEEIAELEDLYRQKYPDEDLPGEGSASE